MADEDYLEPRNTSGDNALLLEIRERYRYACDSWADIRKERQKDMRCLSGDPWEPEDRKTRKDASRPCINHDELNQYVFQFVNNLRQNPRGVKIDPRGNGANDQTAELRQDIIRTVEANSQAKSIYLKACQDMAEGSYGFCRISRRYVLSNPDPKDPRFFDQEIVVKPIPNPDSVLYDPDCKEPDWSDAAWCFVVEPISKEEFKRRYPKAQKTDFTVEDIRVAKDWIQDKTVILAEYWKVVVTSEVKKRNGRKRTVESKKLIQYITNGVEILEEIEQPGEEIPIPACVGLERYLDEGNGPKRQLISLPRFAREPQMSLAYLVSQEMEEAGMSPKVPVRGWVGQFETDKDAHDTSHKIPHPYLQYDYPDWALERGITLPLPEIAQFTPNFQAYEVAKDGARRAIQAAMGISPLPTAAQRSNEKSGIALDRIETQEAIGSFHFVDGFDRFIERAGRIMNSWIKATYDTEREMGLQKINDSRRVVRINTAEPYPGQDGKPEQYQIGEEDHDVTVSTAPSYQSQREAVDAFLENLIANIGTLPVPPPAAAKLLALAIRMKQMGPKGDEMADIIAPPEGDQGQQLAGLQTQMQQQQQAFTELQTKFQELLLERQGKVIDNEYKAQNAERDRQVKLAIAEIETKAQNLSERYAFVEEFIKQQHAQAHEAGMQAQDQAHEHSIADKQAQVASAQSAQDAAQTAAQQAQQPQVSQQ